MAGKNMIFIPLFVPFKINFKINFFIKQKEKIYHYFQREHELLLKDGKKIFSLTKDIRKAKNK